MPREALCGGRSSSPITKADSFSFFFFFCKMASHRLPVAVRISPLVFLNKIHVLPAYVIFAFDFSTELKVRLRNILISISLIKLLLVFFFFRPENQNGRFWEVNGFLEKRNIFNLLLLLLSVFFFFSNNHLFCKSY